MRGKICNLLKWDEWIMDEAPLLYAPALGKINLYLKITGRREDGYHTIESLFLPLADPADDVAVELGGAHGIITVGCSDLAVPGGTKNLAGRAAERWAEKTGVTPRWDVNIAKHIPIAAGMGGGSSDAGTTLRLLNDYYGKPLTDEALAEMAVALGADVPYFLHPVPALMTGIGEIMTPLDFAVPEIPLLLVAPEFPVSAAEAYRLVPESAKTPMAPATREAILSALQAGDWPELVRHLGNDLQPGVFAKYPLLALLEKALLAAGALRVLMTGSGPTLFAIFRNAEAADQAAEIMQKQYPEYRTLRPPQK